VLLDDTERGRHANAAVDDDDGGSESSSDDSGGSSDSDDAATTTNASAVARHLLRAVRHELRSYTLAANLIYVVFDRLLIGLWFVGNY
jgi:hypothetical protein